MHLPKVIVNCRDPYCLSLPGIDDALLHPPASGIHLLPHGPRGLLGHILLLGAVLFASWRYARRTGLLQEEVTHQKQCAMERRIVVAQALYAFGMCLCWVNTYLSIAFIVLVQLNFALAPRLPFLSEI